MVRISVRIDERLRRSLDAEARARGVKTSEIVREAIERHLGDRPKPENAFELAQRIGFIGSIDGLPPDLSTNKAYFEGFGGE